MTKQQYNTAVVIGPTRDDKIVLYLDGQLVQCDVTARQHAVTPAQVAQILLARGVCETVPSTAAVCGWLRSGLLRGFRVPGRGRGGQWRVPLGNLDGFVPPSKRKAE